MKFITAYEARRITKPVHDNIIKFELVNISKAIDEAIHNGKFSIKIFLPLVCRKSIANELSKYGYRVTFTDIYTIIRWDLTLWQEFKGWINKLYCKW